MNTYKKREVTGQYWGEEKSRFDYPKIDVRRSITRQIRDVDFWRYACTFSIRLWS